MNDSTLEVFGMRCGGCVSRVTRAIHGQDPASEVEVDLRQGVVRVRHVATLSGAQLAESVSAAGYPARAWTAEPDPRSGCA